jgi:hypothetical protein
VLETTDNVPSSPFAIGWALSALLGLEYCTAFKDDAGPDRRAQAKPVERRRPGGTGLFCQKAVRW